jgi:hypothetical protein
MFRDRTVASRFVLGFNVDSTGANVLTVSAAADVMDTLRNNPAYVAGNLAINVVPLSNITDLTLAATGAAAPIFNRPVTRTFAPMTAPIPVTAAAAADSAEIQVTPTAIAGGSRVTLALHSTSSLWAGTELEYFLQVAPAAAPVNGASATGEDGPITFSGVTATLDLSGAKANDVLWVRTKATDAGGTVFTNNPAGNWVSFHRFVAGDIGAAVDLTPEQIAANAVTVSVKAGAFDGGEEGTTLTTERIVLELSAGTWVGTTPNVSTWVTGLPDGITVTATATVSGVELTIALNGDLPAWADDAADDEGEIVITIPFGAITDRTTGNLTVRVPWEITEDLT